MPRISLITHVFIFQRQGLPPICTHNVIDDYNDQVLTALRRCRLFNNREDRVKVFLNFWFLHFIRITRVNASKAVAHRKV